MDKIIVSFLAFLSLGCQMPVRAYDAGSSPDAGLLGYVNILQGTDSTMGLSHGNTLSLMGMPWGMLDWSIENTESAWFFHPNGKIDGIRATHQPSPWINDYGQFVLMPQVGNLKWTANDRMSDYDTTTAILRPDYEKLDLQKGQITSELTATERCAVFRFTFHGESGRLLINATGGSEIHIDGRTIRGISRANSGGVSGILAPISSSSSLAISIKAVSWSITPCRADLRPKGTMLSRTWSLKPCPSIRSSSGLGVP
jgi:putative alpha-1,2-mannosidase